MLKYFKNFKQITIKNDFNFKEQMNIKSILNYFEQKKMK